MLDCLMSSELFVIIVELFDDEVLFVVDGLLKYKVCVVVNLCWIFECEVVIGWEFEVCEVEFFVQFMGVEGSVEEFLFFFCKCFLENSEEFECCVFLVFFEIVCGKLFINKLGYDEYDFVVECRSVM